ncbi:hypothetical protein RBH85_08720 [Streptomyces rochei]|nr:hypothetical protein [Streptomyces rochei]WMI56856.1 hypothetical protein RBH85_08720 [Streptomyces rochei]
MRATGRAGGPPRPLVTVAVPGSRTSGSATDPTSTAVADAATFLRLGTVPAVSFPEAPLKCPAPGVPLPVGPGIGRLVFRALDLAEAPSPSLWRWARAVPPRQPSRSPRCPWPVLPVSPASSARVRVAAPRPASHRSRAHLCSVALEVVKVIALLAPGPVLQAG